MYAVLDEKSLTRHLFKHRVNSGWQTRSPCLHAHWPCF